MAADTSTIRVEKGKKERLKDIPGDTDDDRIGKILCYYEANHPDPTTRAMGAIDTLWEVVSEKRARNERTRPPLWVNTLKAIMRKNMLKTLSDEDLNNALVELLEANPK